MIRACAVTTPATRCEKLIGSSFPSKLG